MNNEYIILNKTSLEKMREELNKGSAHWDGVYVSDYQQGQIDLIDVIISSKSTPLVPEIEKALDEGKFMYLQSHYIHASTTFEQEKQGYISNLKLDI